MEKQLTKTPDILIQNKHQFIPSGYRVAKLEEVALKQSRDKVFRDKLYTGGAVRVSLEGIAACFAAFVE